MKPSTEPLTLTLPTLEEVSTVHGAIIQTTAAEFMTMLTMSFKDAVLELKKRTEQQAGQADLYLLSYLGGVTTAAELLKEANIILARFSGYRHFLLELTRLMIRTALPSDARGKVLTVEAGIEQQMSCLFDRVVSAMNAETGFYLQWTEYLGFSLTLTEDSATTTPA